MTITSTPQFFDVNELGMYVTPMDGDSPQPATKLSLSDLGVSVGDILFLQPTGDYANRSDVIEDTRTGLTGVFEGASGFVATSGGTVGDQFFEPFDGNAPGNIDEDFVVYSEGGIVQVPAGATHLLLASPDIFVSDNSDPDNDFGALISFAPAGTVIFTEGPDVFGGTAGNDIVNALGGDDDISGGAGDDELDGGAGNDQINPGDNTNYDSVIGSTGNDTITFDNGISGYHEVSYGRLDAGVTASINGLTNAASVDKGANGTDTIIGIENPLFAGLTTGGLGFYGSNFDDVINITVANEGQWMQFGGLSGNDTINILNDNFARLDYRRSPDGINADLSTGQIADGYGSVDTITGNLWEIRGSDHDDVMRGSSRNESFIGRRGDDSFDGAGGVDRVRYDRSGMEEVTVDLEAGTATLRYVGGDTFNDTLARIENIRGTRDGDDMIMGDGAANRLEGRGGADTIHGRAGNDDLRGEAGDDTMSGGLGNDAIDGGDGIDTLTFAEASGGVQAYLNVGITRGAEGRDRLENIENLLGSVHDDRLIGDAGDNDIVGGEGNDIIKGKGGNDAFFGEGGNDKIRGEDGEDLVLGGAGDDILFGLSGEDELDGANGTDYIYGGRDADVITGGNDDDFLRGNLGNDTINGGAGDDDLRGGGSNDTLYGDAGNDFIVGEGGFDRIDGGAGNDILLGGFGGGTNDARRDTFVFSSGGGFDQIRDFENGIDLIDLSDFGFTDFSTDVLSLASDRPTGLRIDFGGGDLLFLTGFTKTDFTADDVLLG
jgi:Ca2+-binding RTX toxin-like protein